MHSFGDGERVREEAEIQIPVRHKNRRERSTFEMDEGSKKESGKFKQIMLKN
jgi:hypothetical protein